MAARVNGAMKTSCVLYFRSSLSLPLSLLPLLIPCSADAGGECVCYYFVDILVQAECAGAWLVMAGYVCNVWADAARGGTEEKRRGGSTAGTADSWILICQPQAAVRQTVDGGQSTHDDGSPDKSESGPQLAARSSHVTRNSQFADWQLATSSPLSTPLHQQVNAGKVGSWHHGGMCNSALSRNCVDRFDGTPSSAACQESKRIKE